mmetsp:Transcript_35982/g.75640  ORF Transcript_35982/g.75640 Transcript_35982/m.75640 type:complete len:360 (-) Transcript_35982:129-1208(-)
MIAVPIAIAGRVEGDERSVGFDPGDYSRDYFSLLIGRGRGGTEISPRRRVLIIVGRGRVREVRRRALEIVRRRIIVIYAVVANVTAGWRSLPSAFLHFSSTGVIVWRRRVTPQAIFSRFFPLVSTVVSTAIVVIRFEDTTMAFIVSASLLNGTITPRNGRPRTGRIGRVGARARTVLIFVAFSPPVFVATSIPFVLSFCASAAASISASAPIPFGTSAILSFTPLLVTVATVPPISTMMTVTVLPQICIISTVTIEFPLPVVVIGCHSNGSSKLVDDITVPVPIVVVVRCPTTLLMQLFAKQFFFHFVLSCADAMASIAASIIMVFILSHVIFKLWLMFGIFVIHLFDYALLHPQSRSK